MRDNKQEVAAIVGHQEWKRRRDRKTGGWGREGGGAVNAAAFHCVVATFKKVTLWSVSLQLKIRNEPTN